MVAQGVVWVDIEPAIRDWARDEGLASRRVFFGTNNSAPFPQIVIQRLGGTDEAAFIQFDVWAATKAVAAAIAADLATACDQLTRFDGAGVLLHGATVDSVRWFPDPDNDMPRYIVDVIFTATANALGS